MHSSHTTYETAYSGDPYIRTSPVGARWNRDEPQAPSDSPTAARPAAGPRRELERYRISSGERVIYGQRVDGVVRVTDRPASGQGRSYLIERKLHTNAELRALVADYVAQAAERDAIPCHVHW